MSGGFPASSLLVSTAFRSRVPENPIAYPVSASQGATAAWKLASSSPPQTPSTFTCFVSVVVATPQFARINAKTMKREKIPRRNFVRLIKKSFLSATSNLNSYRLPQT